MERPSWASGVSVVSAIMPAFVSVTLLKVEKLPKTKNMEGLCRCSTLVHVVYKVVNTPLTDKTLYSLHLAIKVIISVLCGE